MTTNNYAIRMEWSDGETSPHHITYSDDHVVVHYVRRTGSAPTPPTHPRANRPPSTESSPS